MTSTQLHQLQPDFVFPERHTASESTSLSSSRSVSPVISAAPLSVNLSHTRTPSGAAVAAASFAAAAAAAQHSASQPQPQHQPQPQSNHQTFVDDSRTNTIQESLLDLPLNIDNPTLSNYPFSYGLSAIPSIGTSAIDNQPAQTQAFGNHISHQKTFGSSSDYFSQSLSSSTSASSTPGPSTALNTALLSSPTNLTFQDSYRTLPSLNPSTGSSRQTFTTSPSLLSQPFFYNPSSQKFQHPRSFQHRTSTNRSFSSNAPIGASSPALLDPRISFENLIQLDIQLSVASKATKDAASRLAEVIVRHDVFNRLKVSLRTFYMTMVNKSKHDSSKFASPFIQSAELISSILKSESQVQHTGFVSSLKPTNKGLINSFITLIKTSPSFICACISTMSEADINLLFGPFEQSSSLSGFEELASLHRYNALDIIYYSFFPPIAPIKQRHDYFSFILAFAFDNSSDTKYQKLIIAILDRIYSSCNYDLSGVEEMLLGMLQDGQFLSSNKAHLPVPEIVQPNTNGKSTYTPDTPSSSSTNLTPVSATGVFSLFPASAPDSSYSSPELPAVSSSALATPTFAKSNASPAALSLQRLNNSYRHQTPPRSQPTQLHSSHHPNVQQSHHQPSPKPGPDFEEKKTKFLASYITRILTHLNNTANESIPVEFKDFVTLTLSKVSELQRKTALYFIFHKFYIGHCLLHMITSPESFGLLQDFFVTDTQRQRVLIYVFQYLQLYSDVVLLDATASHSLDISPTIQSQIFQLYEQFKTLIPSSDDIPPSIPKSPSSATSENFDLDESFVNYPFEGGSFYGQLITLAPADIYTLYSGLFSSIINKNTSSKPINVEQSIPINQPTNSFSYSALYDNIPFSANNMKSESTPALHTINLAQSLASLDEISAPFETEMEDSSYNIDDSAFEWNLTDICSDIEPAAKELYQKFPYLQFRQPSSWNYLNNMRPHKSQNFRLPHPYSERWQIFRVNDDNTVTEVNELSIIDPNRDFESELQTSLLDDTSYLYEERPGLFDIEKPCPISFDDRVYCDTVLKALNSIIAENSSSILNFQPEKEYETHLTTFAGSFQTIIHSHWHGDFSKIPSLPNTNKLIPSLSHLSSSSPRYLAEILTDAANNATSLRDYYKGCEYFNASQALLKLLPHPSAANYNQVAFEVNGFILTALKLSKERLLETMSSTIENCDDIAGPYQVYLQQNLSACDFHVSNIDEFRTKIWYSSEVRNSPLWTRARDVAVSLRKGSSASSSLEDEDLSLPSQRSHTLKRNSSTTSLSSAAAYTFKRLTGTSNKRDYINKRHSMSHISSSSFPNPSGNNGNASHSHSTSSESLFAPYDLAGDNKLNDKESESTERWLDGQGIQNFCTGEEIIHRFLCEVDDFVKRVIGDLSSTHPNRGQSMLSSSVLFRFDLLKLIGDIDGPDRSSTASFSFPKQSNTAGSNNGTSGSTGSGFLGGLFGSSTKLDSETDLRPRGSTEGLPAEVYRQTHTRSKTSVGGSYGTNANTGNASSQVEISRSYSFRSHKSRKSSPKLMDMFTSLDLGMGTSNSSARKPGSTTDLRQDTATGIDPSSIAGLTINRPHSSTAGAVPEKISGHRRNKSLTESFYGSGLGNSYNSSMSGMSVPSGGFAHSSIITEESGLGFNSSRSQSSAPSITLSYSQSSLPSSSSEDFTPFHQNQFPSSSTLTVQANASTSTQPFHTRLQSSSSSSLSFTSIAPPSPPTASFLDDTTARKQERQHHERKRSALKSMIMKLRMQLISLVLTDLGIEAWSEGSETDKWICSNIVSLSFDHQARKTGKKPETAGSAGLSINIDSKRNSSTGASSFVQSSLHTRRQSNQGPKLREIDLQMFLNGGASLRPSFSLPDGNPTSTGMTGNTNSFSRPSIPTFPYEEAYGNLLFRLSVSPSPMTKLATIHELVRLVVSALKMRTFNNYNQTSTHKAHNYSWNGISSTMSPFSNPGTLETTASSTTSSTIATANVSASPSITNLYGTLTSSTISQDQVPISAATATSASIPHMMNTSSSTPLNISAYTNSTELPTTPNISSVLTKSVPVAAASIIPEKTSNRRSSLSMTSLGEVIATVEAKRTSSGMYVAGSPVKFSSNAIPNITPGTATPSNTTVRVGPSPNATFNVTSRTPSNGPDLTAVSNAATMAAAAEAAAVGPNTDTIVEELCRIFKKKGYHSNTLFRDLQLIATFIPTEILDKTDMGKSFWDVSLAALSLKEDYLDVVVNTAYDIFKVCTGMIEAARRNRNDAKSDSEESRFDDADEDESAIMDDDDGNENMLPSNGNNSGTIGSKTSKHGHSLSVIDDDFYSQWSLSDCAKLWAIAAREGDIDGQRELGIMYMSHPEIVPTVLPTFAKLRSVFPSSVLQSYKEGSSSNSSYGNSNTSQSRSYSYTPFYDRSSYNDDVYKVPSTSASEEIKSAIIKTWMTNAAIHGDNIATEYLMQEGHGGNF